MPYIAETIIYLSNHNDAPDEKRKPRYIILRFLGAKSVLRHITFRYALVGTNAHRDSHISKYSNSRA